MTKDKTPNRIARQIADELHISLTAARRLSAVRLILNTEADLAFGEIEHGEAERRMAPAVKALGAELASILLWVPELTESLLGLMPDPSAAREVAADPHKLLAIYESAKQLAAESEPAGTVTFSWWGHQGAVDAFEDALSAECLARGFEMPGEPIEPGVGIVYSVTFDLDEAALARTLAVGIESTYGPTAFGWKEEPGSGSTDNVERCAECGEPMFFEPAAASHHGCEGEIDYDTDEDHVAIAASALELALPAASKADKPATIGPNWSHPSWPTVEDYAYNVAAGDSAFWACGRCGFHPDAKDTPGYAEASPQERQRMNAENYLKLYAHHLTCLGEGLTIEWHQARIDPFRSAEFYDWRGHVATVRHADGSHVVIDSEGARRRSHVTVNHGGEEYETILATPSAFRETFPDGQLPEDGTDGWAVICKGWFSVYTPEGELAVDEPDFDLDEAIAAATTYLRERSKVQAARS